MRVVAILQCVSILAGCGFIDDVPDDARVRCATDGDCPTDRQCNLQTLLCAEPGDDVEPPSVVGARFEPAAVGDAVARLTIDADEPIGASQDVPAPALFESRQSGAVFAGVEGSQAAWLIDGALLDEGLYVVETVTFADAAGNVATRRLGDVALLVDRTAPALANLTATLPEGGLADVAGQSLLRVGFIANEPLLGATATLGAAVAACAVDASGSHSCDVTVTAATVPNGTSPVVVTASDAAGNSTQRALDVFADTAAPVVVTDSVTLQIDPPGPAVASGAATPGAVLKLSLLLDEPPESAAIELESDSATLPFDVVVDGRRVTATLLAPATVADGTWPIVSRFADRFGHSGSDALALPAPFVDGVPFSNTVTSGCLHLPLDCLDYDGDGVFASEPSCATGLDCSDIDATVFPLAPEIPGDGVGNDCSGAPDMLIDDAAGVFVAQGGNDAGAATMMDPAASVEAALALIDSERRFVFIGDPNGFDSPMLVAALADGSIAGVIGGLISDPQGWRRGGPATPLASGPPVGLADGVMLDGVSVFAPTVISGDGNVIVRSEVFSLLIVGGITLVSASTIAALDTQTASLLRVSDSVLLGDDIHTLRGSVLLHRVRAHNQIAVNGGQVAITSSVLSAEDLTLTVTGGGSVDVAGSALFSDAASGPGSLPLVLVNTGAGLTRLVGTVLHRRGTGPIVSHNSGDLELHACSFGRTDADVFGGGTLLVEVSTGASVSDPTALDGATVAGCEECTFNALSGHALAGFAEPPCAAAADPILHGASWNNVLLGGQTGVFSDVFGRCRTNDDGAVDTGPYEAIAGTVCTP